MLLFQHALDEASITASRAAYRSARVMNLTQLDDDRDVQTGTSIARGGRDASVGPPLRESAGLSHSRSGANNAGQRKGAGPGRRGRKMSATACVASRDTCLGSRL